MRARTAFLLSLLLLTGVVVWAATVLPDRVPVHWGSGGAADRVVSRERAVVELALIGAALSLLLGGAAAAVHRVPLAWVNVPHKDHWSRPENRPELHRRLATDLFVIATATLLLLVVIAVQVVLVADDPDPRLGPVFWTAFVLYVVLVLGLSVHSALRRYRPPAVDR